jgi:hypothetical protein
MTSAGQSIARPGFMSANVRSFDRLVYADRTQVIVSFLIKQVISNLNFTGYSPAVIFDLSHPEKRP